VSMESSFYAEYAEGVRKDWIAKLRGALDDSRKTYEEKVLAIEKIVEEMGEFFFSE